MKLFIYDKFWDALLSLNKTTQIKVTDFISKFRTNSKSAAIHLESIQTFKDQSLKTARIDQKYRAILKEVKASDLYLLVWVDNHDEAMDWAKNKIIDWNEQTQAFQVYTVDEVAAVADAKTAVTNDLFIGEYDGERLIKIGVPEILLPSVLKVNNFEGLEKLESYLPIDVFENLFYLLEGAHIDTLISEVQEGRTNNDELRSKNNARSFIELTDDEIFNEALQGSLQKWKYYLHPSQSAFVYGDFKESIKLSGGAGTGKTIAALHRLKHLAGKVENSLPVLFTTFTKELTENLKGLAQELEIPSGTYLIENIDMLAFRLAQQYYLLRATDKVFGLSAIKKPAEIWEQVLAEKLSSFDEEFLQEEYEAIILDQHIDQQENYLKASRMGRGKAISRKDRFLIWELIEDFNQRKAAEGLYYKEEVYNKVSQYLLQHKTALFAHVIVDELQDFSNIELRFIRSLTQAGPNDLFLVGDPLQNIYNKTINFSKAGINVRGNRSKRLRINYRTTEEIKNFAIKVISEENYDDFEGNVEEKKGYLSLFHGVKPQYPVYRTKNEELEAVAKDINQLVEEGYSFNDIVVAARTKDAVDDFRNHFHKVNIPYVNKNLLNNQNEGVRLSTFHGLKGLEFKQVFLVDVNDRTFPRQPFNFSGLTPEEQQQIIKTEKALFYVACSRAIQRLMISGVGTRSAFASV
ncbi:DNA helicase [Niastella koreensis]|uniref:DNA 3'-5' helicase n=2 Tax=Niastella koreensis TaxID=354356 RepID=G8TQ71_NIAKG|nr:3'-5' exonuclease [Niastella koreensis]AEW01072.1 UvrD/REP helicase [Niastella koreensis GR20-10]OQP42675.1 DNA helicase [Niastella koreensis]